MSTAIAEKSDQESVTAPDQRGRSPLAPALRYSREGLLQCELAGASESGRHPGLATAAKVPKWFWYSLMSLLCWTAWALTAKAGSAELPASAMQFISGLGFLFVSFAAARVTRTDSHGSPKGKVYSVISGVLLAAGGLASFAAYRSGQSTAATTGITSLYPAITVVLALVILKERLTRLQVTGLCLSAIAIVLLSF